MRSAHMREGLIAAIASLLLAGAACQSRTAAPAEVATAPVAAEADVLRGAEIAGRLCSGCHAVGPTDAGLHAEAPPLRLLSQKYPIRALEEALAEGIVVGHPDMPAFAFEPDEIEALLSYLESIQAPS